MLLYICCIISSFISLKNIKRCLYVFIHLERRKICSFWGLKLSRQILMSWYFLLFGKDYSIHKLHTTPHLLLARLPLWKCPRILCFFKDIKPNPDCYWLSKKYVGKPNFSITLSALCEVGISHKDTLTSPAIAWYPLFGQVAAVS